MKPTFDSGEHGQIREKKAVLREHAHRVLNGGNVPVSINSLLMLRGVDKPEGLLMRLVAGNLSRKDRLAIRKIPADDVTPPAPTMPIEKTIQSKTVRESRENADVVTINLDTLEESHKGTKISRALGQKIRKIQEYGLLVIKDNLRLDGKFDISIRYGGSSYGSLWPLDEGIDSILQYCERFLSKRASKTQ